MGRNYIRRGNWYYYLRRVPKRISQYDPRTLIRIALKTKEEKEARRITSIYDDFIEKYWADLIRSGKTDPDLKRFDQIRALAKAHGFAYKNMAEVLDSPFQEVLTRIEMVADSTHKAGGLLGGSVSSGVKLKDCMELYWPLCVDRFTEKNEHQIRKYKNPRNLAMKHFIHVVGDRDISKVERSHVLRFRSWLMERIANDEIGGNMANKSMRYVKDVLKTVALSLEIDVDYELLFNKTRVQEVYDARPPFEARFVQDVFINSMPFEELAYEARMLVYFMMDTGARENELIGLDPEQDFFLDASVPHIWIRKNKLRGLKTKNSDRKIPLVGISLWAARQVFPFGFKKYHENPDTASNKINKYLRENNLKPTGEHTLYSLRHTFKDRLRDAGAPEEVIDELMGHIKNGVQYGRGHTLETKHKWLQKIAYKVPESFQERSREEAG